MDGNPSMRGPSKSATHIARADCPHLSDPVWEALQRLATVIGEAAVAMMLRTLSPTEQHGVALGFIVKGQRGAAAATTTTAFMSWRTSEELGVWTPAHGHGVQGGAQTSV
ncbi:hypothetical protein PI125_g23966 [Phytophthora idaei]|nr:hypothetical protein PI125_g23966 [Phytophthora idaei]KAG3125670.1 hypothetical protein PI126_g22658 [Phytophthora idaei]